MWIPLKCLEAGSRPSRSSCASYLPILSPISSAYLITDTFAVWASDRKPSRNVPSHSTTEATPNRREAPSELKAFPRSWIAARRKGSQTSSSIPYDSDSSDRHNARPRTSPTGQADFHVCSALGRTQLDTPTTLYHHGGQLLGIYPAKTLAIYQR